MRTDAEIDGILTKWGHWKTGIPYPRQDNAHRNNEGWGEPGGIPPGVVWMTPEGQIILFRDVSKCVQLLPGVQKLTIQETYLQPYDTQSQIAKCMGINESTLRRYQEQGRRMIAAALDMLKTARDERAVA